MDIHAECPCTEICAHLTLPGNCKERVKELSKQMLYLFTPANEKCKPNTFSAGKKNTERDFRGPSSVLITGMIVGTTPQTHYKNMLKHFWRNPDFCCNTSKGILIQLICRAGTPGSTMMSLWHTVLDMRHEPICLDKCCSLSSLHCSGQKRRAVWSLNGAQLTQHELPYDTWRKERLLPACLLSPRLLPQWFIKANLLKPSFCTYRSHGY